MAKVVETLKSHSSRWIKSQDVGNFARQRGYGCFSVGKSQTATLVRYIQNQADHRRRVSFQEEFREFCAVTRSLSMNGASGIEPRL
jgi:hypothetical protein